LPDCILKDLLLRCVHIQEMINAVLAVAGRVDAVSPLWHLRSTALSEILMPPHASGIRTHIQLIALIDRRTTGLRYQDGFAVLVSEAFTAFPHAAFMNLRHGIKTNEISDVTVIANDHDVRV